MYYRGTGPVRTISGAAHLEARDIGLNLRWVSGLKNTGMEGVGNDIIELRASAGLYRVKFFGTFERNGQEWNSPECEFYELGDGVGGDVGDGVDLSADRVQYQHAKAAIILKQL